ncbi:MAG: hypothetical protein AAFR21_14835 [Pseudomonadota bacterium]
MSGEQDPQYAPLTGSQARAALGPVSDIAHLGTRLAYEWPTHPASPYFIERLAYARARTIAMEAGDPIDDAVNYGRLFEAMPEGSRLSADAGAAMHFEAHYREAIDACSAAAPFQAQKPLSGALRAQGLKTPVPIRAMERARACRRKAFTKEEAAIEAQRVLSSAGLFPLQPLPILFEIPRLRADGDWMVGALRRFRDGLAEAIDLLDAATAFLARAEEVLGKPTAKPKAAWRALPVLAGLPAVRSNGLASRLSISQKAAIAALEELETLGLAREIRGLKSWKVWAANDPVLGLGRTEPQQPDPMMSFASGLSVIPKEPRRIAS